MVKKVNKKVRQDIAQAVEDLPRILKAQTDNSPKPPVKISFVVWILVGILGIVVFVMWILNTQAFFFDIKKMPQEEQKILSTAANDFQKIFNEISEEKKKIKDNTKQIIGNVTDEIDEEENSEVDVTETEKTDQIIQTLTEMIIANNTSTQLTNTTTANN